MNVNAAAQAEAVRQQELMAQQQALLAQQQEVARQQAADAREQEMERRRQEYALAQAKAQEEANQVGDCTPLFFVHVCMPSGLTFDAMLLNDFLFRSVFSFILPGGSETTSRHQTTSGRSRRNSGRVFATGKPASTTRSTTCRQCTSPTTTIFSDGECTLGPHGTTAAGVSSGTTPAIQRWLPGCFATGWYFSGGVRRRFVPGRTAATDATIRTGESTQSLCTSTTIPITTVQWGLSRWQRIFWPTTTISTSVSTSVSTATAAAAAAAAINGGAMPTRCVRRASPSNTNTGRSTNASERAPRDWPRANVSCALCVNNGDFVGGSFENERSEAFVCIHYTQVCTHHDIRYSLQVVRVPRIQVYRW